MEPAEPRRYSMSFCFKIESILNKHYFFRRINGQ